MIALAIRCSVVKPSSGKMPGQLVVSSPSHIVWTTPSTSFSSTRCTNGAAPVSQIVSAVANTFRLNDTSRNSGKPRAAEPRRGCRRTAACSGSRPSRRRPVADASSYCDARRRAGPLPERVPLLLPRVPTPRIGRAHAGARERQPRDGRIRRVGRRRVDEPKWQVVGDGEGGGGEVAPSEVGGEADGLVEGSEQIVVRVERHRERRWDLLDEIDALPARERGEAGAVGDRGGREGDAEALCSVRERRERERDVEVEEDRVRPVLGKARPSGTGGGDAAAPRPRRRIVALDARRAFTVLVPPSSPASCCRGGAGRSARRRVVDAAMPPW